VVGLGLLVGRGWWPLRMWWEQGSGGVRAAGGAGLVAKENVVGAG